MIPNVIDPNLVIALWMAVSAATLGGAVAIHCGAKNGLQLSTGVILAMIAPTIIPAILARRAFYDWYVKRTGSLVAIGNRNFVLFSRNYQGGNRRHIELRWNRRKDITGEDVGSIFMDHVIFRDGRPKSKVEVLIALIGGNCPVQAEGTVNGKPFYFRARGHHWAMAIGGDVTGPNPEWFRRREYGATLFGAGWMPEDDAKRFISECALAYANGEPSE